MLSSFQIVEEIKMGANNMLKEILVLIMVMELVCGTITFILLSFTLFPILIYGYMCMECSLFLL